MLDTLRFYINFVYYFARTLHLQGIFLCKNLSVKEEMLMFTDEILERLFAIKEIQKLTLSEQSMLVDAFEEIWNEMEEKHNATISKP